MIILMSGAVKTLTFDQFSFFLFVCNFLLSTTLKMKSVKAKPELNFQVGTLVTLNEGGRWLVDVAGATFNMSL